MDPRLPELGGAQSTVGFGSADGIGETGATGLEPATSGVTGLNFPCK
jgi:hypothetical protein